MTSSSKSTLERIASRVATPEPAYERFQRRRDHRRRTQRITAGVVGIAVFVAAVWVVTSVASLDRSETAIRPGGTGSVETGPAMTGPAPKGLVGDVPETDYFLDLNTGEATPLPESIVGSGAGGYAASPDGSRLAYTARGDDGGALLVATLDGSQTDQVTHGLDAVEAPAWSHDGSKIAYIGYHDGGLHDLYVLDVATGESTQLTFAAPDPAAPDWSLWRAFLPSFTADDTSIVYGAGRCDLPRCVEDEAEIRMIPVGGGESALLVKGLTDVELSPDGSLLAYGCQGSHAICVANTDGTDERVVVQGTGDAVNGTSWSPDGTRIPYFTFHAQDVFVVDLTTGQTTYVAEGGPPTWLNDHTLIVEIGKCYDPGMGGWNPALGCPA